jgi:lipid II:glycine glycyltransferase (peptidoglycan interpeptide bridge formation enzyme)
MIQQPGQNILQSWEWGALKKRYGWRPLRLQLMRDDVPVAGAQVLLKQSPLGSFAYLPRGPLVTPGNDLLVPFLSELDATLAQLGCMAAKIELPIESSEISERDLTSAGWVRGDDVQPRSTLIVDLTADVPTLQSRLSSSTRHNIRVASLRGARVREGDRQDLPSLIRMLTAPNHRARFPIHDGEYFTALWDQLAPAGGARLFVVEHEGQVIAATLVVLSGDRGYYLYGGFSYASRHLKLNDLMQWSIMLHLKEMGYAAYDLWGIPDEVGRTFKREGHPMATSTGEPGHLWGVYHFKRGFGGNVFRFAGAFDRIYRPMEWFIAARAWRAWRLARGKGNELLSRWRPVLTNVPHLTRST